MIRSFVATPLKYDLVVPRLVRITPPFGQDQPSEPGAVHLVPRDTTWSGLRRIEAPHLEHREMLDRRLRWIANAREVARMGWMWGGCGWSD